MKAFLEKWTNIKIALNFHAYGNLFIYPFNFDNSENSLLIKNYSNASRFYNSIVKNAKLPPGNLPGNGAQSIRYTANGEASDYMLAMHGIFAMSPELGTNTAAAQNFFISDVNDLKSIL
jgi:hypothetical protein